MSESFPDLQQFEGLLHYASQRCTQDKWTREDIVQDLRIKYFECCERLAGKSAIEFVKYYKTVIWNYVRSFYKVNRSVEFNEDLLWDNIKGQKYYEQLKNNDYDDLNNGKNLAIVIREMYEDGRLLTLLEEYAQKEKKELDRKDLIRVLATLFAVKNCRIVEVFNELKETKITEDMILDSLSAKDRYRKAHPEAVKASQKKYRKNHAEQLRNYAKTYSSANSDKIRNYHRQYYLARKGELLQYQAWYRDNCSLARAKTQREYYQRNRSGRQQYNADYYRRNVEKLKLKTQDSSKRKTVQQNYYCRNLERLRAQRRERYQKQKLAMKQKIAQD